MKVERLNTLADGTWARDCELLCLSDCKGFKIAYHRDEDDTYWTLQCKGIVVYNVIGEEFSRTGYTECLSQFDCHFFNNGTLYSQVAERALRPASFKASITRQ